MKVLDVLARIRSLRLPSVARLEFIPMKIGAGMTILIEGVIYKQTLNYPRLEGEGFKIMGRLEVDLWFIVLPVSFLRKQESRTG